MGKWKVALDASRTAQEHMRLDAQLGQEGAAVRRLFLWQRPAFSLGCRQPDEGWLQGRHFSGMGIERVERPTAGGLGCHGSDLCCAVVIPHAQCRSIHAALVALSAQVAAVCQRLGVPVVRGPLDRVTRARASFDPVTFATAFVPGRPGWPHPGHAAQARPSQVEGFAEDSAPGITGAGPRVFLGAARTGWPVGLPSAARRIRVCLNALSPYALFSGTRKVAGFAARRYRQAWLIQGTLLVRPVPASLLRVMPRALRRSLLARSISLSEAAECDIDEASVASQWALAPVGTGGS